MVIGICRSHDRVSGKRGIRAGICLLEPWAPQGDRISMYIISYCICMRSLSPPSSEPVQARDSRFSPRRPHPAACRKNDIGPVRAGEIEAYFQIPLPLIR